MWLTLWAALAADLSVNADAPVVVAVDGVVWVSLGARGAATAALPPGAHTLRVEAGGGAYTAAVTVDQADVRVEVAQGRVTVDGADASAPAGPRAVLFTVRGNAPLMVVVDGQRHVVGPGPGQPLPLAPGAHPVSVRSADGAEVYARGEVVVGEGAGQPVLTLHEGRLPEAAGEAFSFVTRR